MGRKTDHIPLDLFKHIFPKSPREKQLGDGVLGKHVIGKGSLQLGCRELNIISVFSNARESGGSFQHGDEVHSLVENSDDFA